jgi:endonuclease-8
VPEGDVVWYTARRLPAGVGEHQPYLRGQPVTEAVARGKHLLIRTGNGLTVHTHLKMDGSWRVFPADKRLTESHKIRLVLANARWQAAGYLLGITEVLPTAKEDQVVGHLGPDLLGPDWDAAQAVDRLSRDPGKPIGEALLDQRNLSGLGTIYLSETLFLRGIDPWRCGTPIRRGEAGPPGQERFRFWCPNCQK